MSVRYTVLVAVLAALAVGVVDLIPGATAGLATIAGALAAITAILLQPHGSRR